MQLTMDQISQLEAMGRNMNGVPEGAEATAEEMEALGLQPDVGPNVSDDLSAPTQAAPPAPVTAQPAMPPAAVAGAMNAVSPPAPVTQEQPDAPKQGGLISGLGDMLFGPQEEVDQFSNLNRQQRMMLAFGAIKDAGFALQGKEGNSFSNTLKAINDQMDMGRKAKAVAQRQQLLGGLNLGGGEGDAQARRQAILSAAAQGLIDGPTAKLMIEELDRQKTEKTEIAGKAALIARIDALMNDPNLEDALGFEGIVRGFASTVGLDPNVARVNEMIKQVRGDVFLQAFEKLKGGGQITELEGQKAEQAMARLGQMQGYDDYVNSLKELRFYIDIFSRRMQGESIPDEKIYVRGAQNGGGSAGTEPLSDEDLDNLYPPTTD
jgi:hypothetical protein